MNKSELVDAIAAKAEISKSAAGRALNAFMESVTDTLSNGDNVFLIGFGSFFTKDLPERNGHNPKTGKSLKIAATIYPKFKAGKGLKLAVNKNTNKNSNLATNK